MLPIKIIAFRRGGKWAGEVFENPREFDLRLGILVADAAVDEVRPFGFPTGEFVHYPRVVAAQKVAAQASAAKEAQTQITKDTETVELDALNAKVRLARSKLNGLIQLPAPLPREAKRFQQQLEEARANQTAAEKELADFNERLALSLDLQRHELARQQAGEQAESARARLKELSPDPPETQKEPK